MYLVVTGGWLVCDATADVIPKGDSASETTRNYQATHDGSNHLCFYLCNFVHSSLEADMGVRASPVR